MELAWAAGFFDGEGCVTYNDNKPHRTLKVNIGQSGTTEHLERFQQAVGVGKITGPYGPYLEGRRPSWHFNASGEDAHLVMEKLRPFLCSPKLDKYKAVCVELNIVGRR